MHKRRWILFVVWILAIIPSSVLAQDYYFQLPVKTVDVYWNEDGTQSLYYVYVFENDPSGHIIDYVDVALPNNSFDENSISAEVDGNPVYDISRSGYQGTGQGVAIGLGSYAIPPGGRGTVKVFIGVVRNVLYQDSQDENYASAVFAPNTFLSNVIYGTTDITVTFHLPPGVKPDEPRWHEAPAGFPPEPERGLDEQGRIYYSWRNPTADGSKVYTFGASFPKSYVPESSIVRPNPFAFLENINPEDLIPGCCIGFFALIFATSYFSGRRRQMQYLPPKISVEGNGIKRGLTAVEAAILLEQPLDKILTMILFGVLKKNAATVVSRDPLEIVSEEPLPAGLHEYEINFLNAFKLKGKERQRELQSMFVNLIKSVSQKMKGFSRKETIQYYQSITEKAWAQVEAENTPEVKSQKFDQVMEWTMLDRKYDDRMKDIFRNRPVYVPVWWGRYDPQMRRTTSTISTPASSRPSVSPGLPHLPGADFAASIVNGVQTFSGKVVGNINTFTSQVTAKTNPVPVSSSGRRGYSGRSGGCACACACAGCACACAGGGR